MERVINPIFMDGHHFPHFANEETAASHLETVDIVVYNKDVLHKSGPPPPPSSTSMSGHSYHSVTPTINGACPRTSRGSPEVPSKSTSLPRRVTSAEENCLCANTYNTLKILSSYKNARVSKGYRSEKALKAIEHIDSRTSGQTKMKSLETAMRQFCYNVFTQKNFTFDTLFNILRIHPNLPMIVSLECHQTSPRSTPVYHVIGIVPYNDEGHHIIDGSHPKKMSFDLTKSNLRWCSNDRCDKVSHATIFLPSRNFQSSDNINSKEILQSVKQIVLEDPSRPITYKR